MNKKAKDEDVTHWSVTRVAMKWDCSEETVRRRIWAKELFAVKTPEGLVRVPVEAIRDYEAKFLPAA